ncbi:MAG: CBS domain-containing protein [Alphaproteobacteria bacterium]
MSVATILKSKGMATITATTHQRVSELIKTMRKWRIGAVIISNDGVHVEGIVTERDVMHRLDEDGLSFLDKPALEVMTSHVRTCTMETPIIEAMQQMTNHRFRHMPVIHQGRLAGMISIGDVVKHRLEELEFETTHLKRYIAGY